MKREVDNYLIIGGHHRSITGSQKSVNKKLRLNHYKDVKWILLAERRKQRIKINTRRARKP